MLLFKIYEILEYEIYHSLYELPGYFYDLYLIADYECELEENIYDLVVICDTHICTLERVIENEVAYVFQVTGVINSLLAVYYLDVSAIPEEYWHDAYFDAWSDAGVAIGKLLRFSFDFDPKSEEYDW